MKTLPEKSAGSKCCMCETVKMVMSDNLLRRCGCHDSITQQNAFTRLKWILPDVIDKMRVSNWNCRDVDPPRFGFREQSKFLFMKYSILVGEIDEGVLVVKCVIFMTYLYICGLQGRNKLWPKAPCTIHVCCWYPSCWWFCLQNPTAFPTEIASNWWGVHLTQGLPCIEKLPLLIK